MRLGLRHRPPRAFQTHHSSISGAKAPTCETSLKRKRAFFRGATVRDHQPIRSRAHDGIGMPMNSGAEAGAWVVRPRSAGIHRAEPAQVWALIIMRIGQEEV